MPDNANGFVFTAEFSSEISASAGAGANEPVPEPAALSLVVLGLILMLVAKRRVKGVIRQWGQSKLARFRWTILSEQCWRIGGSEHRFFCCDFLVFREEVQCMTPA
jgi:hypothetical protein